MILRPKSLREMEAQLRQVPKEKRKVIVLVGRHPNEGTTNIAMRHHGEWEKEGAVVVRISGEWTPQYLWHNAMMRNASRREMELKHEATYPDEGNTIELLAQFQVPIVNFHGWPANPKWTTNEETFKSGTQVHYFVGPKSKVISRADFSELNSARPIELVVEHRFIGREVLRKKVRAFAEKVAWWDVLFCSKFYVDQCSITKAALDTFDRVHASKLQEVLKHLAATGLKKK